MEGGAKIVGLVADERRLGRRHDGEDLMNGIELRPPSRALAPGDPAISCRSTGILILSGRFAIEKEKRHYKTTLARAPRCTPRW
jgi:hypothetical protein